MKEQAIIVEGLPAGWKAVFYGWPKKNIDYVFDGIGVKLFIGKEDHALLIVEKIQPRRIVLEETNVKNNTEIFKQTMIVDGGDSVIEVRSDNIWRVVKETDIPFNSEEPYLKMYVNECKYILGKFQPSVTLNIYDRLHEFIKENS